MKPIRSAVQFKDDLFHDTTAIHTMLKTEISDELVDYIAMEAEANDIRTTVEWEEWNDQDSIYPFTFYSR